MRGPAGLRSGRLNRKRNLASSPVHQEGHISNFG